jgi:hypothetical protein
MARTALFERRAMLRCPGLTYHHERDNVKYLIRFEVDVTIF